MFTFETTDEKEVRRFRIAQFNGRVTTVPDHAAAVAARSCIRGRLFLSGSIALRYRLQAS